MRWFFTALPGLLIASQTILPSPTEKKRKPSFADASYKFSADISMSPYSGGEDLLTALRIVERMEAWPIQNNPVVYSKRASARAWRLGEEFLIWLPVNYLAMVVQHEVFGHGFRVRDIERVDRAEVAGYGFDGPPPYGPGGGETAFGVSESFTTTENSAVSSAGVEATAILANLTKFKWLESKRVDPRQSLLYLLAQYDLPLYIGTIDLQGEMEGHDIRIYTESVNYTYPNQLLHYGRLKNLAWINLADPFTYYAIYAIFHYISSGKQTHIPMIGGCYLPGLRLGLTPFGPEVFFENYFRYKMPLYWYVKGGQHAENPYYGWGFYGTHLINPGPFSFGLRADFWIQPQLLLYPGNVLLPDINLSQTPNPDAPLYPLSEQKSKRFGGAASLIGSFKQADWFGYELELGGKSAGFLPGYSLRSSITFRMATYVLF